VSPAGYVVAGDGTAPVPSRLDVTIDFRDPDRPDDRTRDFRYAQRIAVPAGRIP
jgi:hypothetical protein